MDGDSDDSFDDVLANIDIPSTSSIGESKSNTDCETPVASTSTFPYPTGTQKNTVAVAKEDSAEAKKAEKRKSTDEQPPKEVKPFPEKVGFRSDPSIPTGAIKKTGKTSYNILVNPRQRGNPALKAITKVPYEFSEITPDYVVGRTACVLFLSLRYHSLNPDYICQRIKQIGNQYELRVLLVQVDVQDSSRPLRHITRVAFLTKMTLMLAWNSDEAGKMIENYKLLENKTPESIMERLDGDFQSRVVSALSTIKPINKTDALELIKRFKNLGNIVKATPEELSECTGIGSRKATILHKALNDPFIM